MTITRKVGIPGSVPHTDDVGMAYIIKLSTALAAHTISTSIHPPGSIILCGGFSSQATVTLPAVKDGLEYMFYVDAACASGQTVIAAPTTGTLVVFNDVAADSITLGQASGAAIGGGVHVFSNGTKWFTNGLISLSSAAAATATMTSPQIVT